MNILIDFWYVWALFAIAIILKLFQPVIKGFVGEKTISTFLSFLPQNEYSILNDIILKTDRGTTQIDHIVVSQYGIFVIETKNYKGWILGKESDEYWTQNIYGKKNKFYNPIRQNYAHTEAIKALLSKCPNAKIIPIVAFSGECELKVNTKSRVVYFSGINKTITKEKENIFTTQEIKEILQIISCADINNKQTRKEHVTEIKHQVKMNEEKISHDICPKCGSKLVLRKSKYGTFKGCSNYPKCRYILK